MKLLGFITICVLNSFVMVDGFHLSFWPLILEAVVLGILLGLFYLPDWT